MHPLDPSRFSSGTHAVLHKISMQGRGLGASQPSKKPPVDKKVHGVAVTEKGRQKCALRDYRITLEKDVANLQKKLKQEVDTHKALERAFRRTLGVLPRFSPSLSPKIQELLAEVAVLEEEVINLEECVVSLRQGLYDEAVYLSTSKQQKEEISTFEPVLTKDGICPKLPLQVPHLQSGSKGKRNPVIAKLLPPVMENKTEESYVVIGGYDGMEPRKSAKDSFVCEKSSAQMNHGYAIHSGRRLPSHGEVARPRIDMSCQTNIMGDQGTSLEKGNQQEGTTKLWLRTSSSIEGDNTDKLSTVVPSVIGSFLDTRESSEPNLLSEEMVCCLSNIFLKFTRPGSLSDCETSSIVSHSTISSVWSFSSRNSVSRKLCMDISEDMEFPDPYRICDESSRRDIGPYKYYHDITSNSLDYSRIPRSGDFFKKLMVLVDKLSIVDLHGLTHQQKLAFWINIYNVCMMHAFLEHGIPTSPDKVVALMRKAVLNVGGHFLSALAIEHFILRLPSDLQKNNWESKEKEGVIMRSTYGLEWPEPLVNFALSCGSCSSPVVRIYRPVNVESELETAKSEYLQAAVGVTPMKVVIPKLLDWYKRDFAKDLESLIEWVSDQLPASLRRSVQKCLENRQGRPVSEVVEVMPYDFNFRYLLAVQLL